jgi:phosphoglycerate kinase
MLNKKTIRDIQTLEGQRVLVRVDFNVPMQNGSITDDARIRAALPTLTYLKDKGAKIILMSHFGRPKGTVVDDMRLTPISQRLSECLNAPVTQLNDCIGDDVTAAVNAMSNGEIIMLENVRFYSEETNNDPEFAKKLASLGDIFVQEAFGTSHRAHASTAGVAQYIPAYAGFLIEKELEFLDKAISQPQRPLMAIIGGAKVSTKFSVLKNLLNVVDTLVIGGGMTYTFLKAQGLEIGTSLCEDEKLEEAKQFLEDAKTSSTSVVLPVDQVVVPEFKEDAPSQIVENDAIPSDHLGVDIGPKTIDIIQSAVKEAGTVLWNGPLGVFEMKPFSKGTFSVAETLANSSAITIIGGGDSAAAIAQAGLTDKMTHISTGGGASLEFLEGKVLPGIDILEDQ